MPDVFNGGYIYESAHMGWMVCFTYADAKGNTYMSEDLVDARSEEHARLIATTRAKAEGLCVTFDIYRYEPGHETMSFIPATA
jgi:hypothetical protein